MEEDTFSYHIDLHLDSMHICIWLFVINVLSYFKTSKVLSFLYILLFILETFRISSCYLYFYITWKFLEHEAVVYTFYGCLMKFLRFFVLLNVFEDTGSSTPNLKCFCIYFVRSVDSTPDFKPAVIFSKVGFSN
jgi:hypothetical protein